jgi:hypothetical protein
MYNPIPTICPHEPCVVCFRGDTDTALALIGDPEFYLLMLVKLGLQPDEAINTLKVVQDEGGLDHDHLLIRVCHRCATVAELEVATVVEGRPVPTYRGTRRS